MSVSRESQIAYNTVIGHLNSLSSKDRKSLTFEQHLNYLAQRAEFEAAKYEFTDNVKDAAETLLEDLEVEPDLIETLVEGAGWAMDFFFSLFKI